MTAKIKLNAASGGGSISIQAPSSSSNNRVIALPDIADGTLVTSESTLDATKLSGNLPALNGSALTNIDGGKFLQIQQDTRTSQASSSSHSTNVAIGGLSVSITPSASTSKVLVLVTLTHGFSSSSMFIYRLLRGSTALNVGTTDPGGSVTGYVGTVAGKATATRGHPVNIMFLDTPNTTSATTYSLTIKHNSGTWYLNTRDGSYAGASSIQAIEVGA